MYENFLKFYEDIIYIYPYLPKFKNILYIFSNKILNIHITQIQKDIINIHKCHLKILRKFPKTNFKKKVFKNSKENYIFC